MNIISKSLYKVSLNKKNRLRKFFKEDKCINEYCHANSSDIISKKKFKKLSENIWNENIDSLLEYKFSRVILNVGAESYKYL